jgi:hypothetical protein
MTDFDLNTFLEGATKTFEGIQDGQFVVTSTITGMPVQDIDLIGLKLIRLLKELSIKKL